MLSFGVTALPDPPYTRLVEVLQNGERNGFEYGWTYDSHILWQESYALLPIAAVQTEKLKLGHCVTNPGIRDPTITASWYATLHDVSDGRAVMGIGRGDSSRRVVGLKPVKVDEFERRLVMIKDLMNGRQVVRDVARGADDALQRVRVTTRFLCGLPRGTHDPLDDLGVGELDDHAVADATRDAERARSVAGDPHRDVGQLFPDPLELELLVVPLDLAAVHQVLDHRQAALELGHPHGLEPHHAT